jgi:hypothetical protein
MPRAKNKSISEPTEILLKLWPFLRWLDHAWLSESGGALIAGPVFARLEPSAQILTHWLCYILDRQQPANALWEGAAPIIAEVVEQFTTGSLDAAEALPRFTELRTGKKSTTLLARSQTLPDGKILEYTPRFPDTPAITATLSILERYDRNLCQYLAEHWDFCTKGAPEETTRCLAYLLFLLSYSKPPSASQSKESQPRPVRRIEFVSNLLSSEQNLEADYQRWVGSGDRFWKRPWAAFRDYLKPESQFRRSFVQALGAIRLEIATYIESRTQEMLNGLELPWDMWNSRFFETILPGTQPTPLLIRSWYDALRAQELVPSGRRVEQFDVTFVYSPNMCERGRYSSCLFRRRSRAWELCLPRQGIEWRGKLCPVTEVIAGIEYACDPHDCPVLVAQPEGICSGCSYRLLERNDETGRS